MKQSTHQPAAAAAPGGRIALAFKLILSCVLVWAMWHVLVLVRLMSERPAPDPYAARALVREQQAEAAAAARERIRFPWPRYPGAKELGRSWVVLNDVPIVDQTFEARGRPDQILAYYRRAMAGRGWQDNTEAFHHLDRRVLGETGSFRNLQDENYLRRYDQVMRSKLALVKMNDSILIEVSPGEKGHSQIALHYAGTPSLADMVLEMADDVERNSGSPKPYLVAQGAPGHDSTRSLMYHSTKPKEAYFSDMVRMLQREGWSRTRTPAMLDEVQPGVLQAMFARDDEVAVLAVKSAGEEGTAAIVTQSRPMRDAY